MNHKKNMNRKHIRYNCNKKQIIDLTNYNIYGYLE